MKTYEVIKDTNTSKTLYHATNKKIKEIGIEKETMFFTDDYLIAEQWGFEHYGNYENFDILEIEVSLSDITEFIPKEINHIHEFERLEINPKFEGKICHCADCSNGYIVKNINNYNLK